jgi:hypothetical protein
MKALGDDVEVCFGDLLAVEKSWAEDLRGFSVDSGITWQRTTQPRWRMR